MKPRTGHIFKRGSIWYIQYQVQGRRVVQSLHTSDKREAEAARREIISPVRFGGVDNHIASLERQLAQLKAQAGNSRGTVSLADAFEAWLSHPSTERAAPKTERDKELAWDRLVAAAPAGIQTVSEISEDIAASIVSAWDADPEISTNLRNRTLKAIRPVFKDTLGSDPFHRIKSRKNRTPAKVKRPLTNDEVSRIIKRTDDDEVAHAVLLGTWTGQRLQDVVLADWSEIDLASGRWIVSPGKTSHSKGSANRQTLVLAKPVLAWLETVPADWRQGSVFPRLAAQYKISQSTLSRWFRAAFEAAGVKDTEAGSATFHSLRHTLQTWFDEAGVPRAVSQAFTGHTSNALSDRYSHVGLQAQEAGLEKLYGSH